MQTHITTGGTMDVTWNVPLRGVYSGAYNVDIVTTINYDGTLVRQYVHGQYVHNLGEGLPVPNYRYMVPRAIRFHTKEWTGWHPVPSSRAYDELSKFTSSLLDEMIERWSK